MLIFRPQQQAVATLETIVWGNDPSITPLVDYLPLPAPYLSNLSIFALPEPVINGSAQNENICTVLFVIYIIVAFVTAFIHQQSSFIVFLLTVRDRFGFLAAVFDKTSFLRNRQTLN